jgi:hypothetical protein
MFNCGELGCDRMASIKIFGHVNFTDENLLIFIFPSVCMQEKNSKIAKHIFMKLDIWESNYILSVCPVLVVIRQS